MFGYLKEFKTYPGSGLSMIALETCHASVEQLIEVESQCYFLYL
jgi:hypothetical protein